jgi:hypothetical protein
MVLKATFTSAVKLFAVLAAIVALPVFFALAVAAVADFSKELVTLIVLCGLVVTVGLATIATIES